MLKLLKPKNDIQASPQIFDLLQLSKAERDYKILCVRAIHELEEWRVAQKNYSSLSRNIRNRIEGVRLRRRAQAAALFYKMVKDNRMKAFQGYMQKLPQRATACYSAS